MDCTENQIATNPCHCLNSVNLKEILSCSEEDKDISSLGSANIRGPYTKLHDFKLLLS